ncbi:Na(+)/H(+) antiporter NhaP [Burkholderia sp. 8Y]|uniref:cation:proton antiporter n=1 Tax=Burkholderia sp. 8Y TaxID=2653133 RepID=UPI0012F100FE|nr:sodium:proton antiporter [Burkholderia sp. 8Y]VXC67453.1 Na(+)/H(+) antiporter NhaP [Burkholderia sp. 8Y]
MFNAITGVLVLAAILAYLNTRFIRLPMTIGIAGLALGLSLLMVAASHLGASELRSAAVAWSKHLAFSQLVLQGMLSLLLFAGALDLNGAVLRRYAWQVAFLSIVSTVVSAALVGAGVYLVLQWCSVPLSMAYCMAFGALIAPTDAVAVIGALRRSSVPQSVETAVAGEALFNDGVGIVLFSVFSTMAASGQQSEIVSALTLFLREAGGGLLLGAISGGILFFMLRSIDRYKVEVMLTIAAVMGGYALADVLHVSGPITTVVAGIIVGNQGRQQAMSEQTRASVDTFWELVDAILNAVLFALIGLEGVAITATVRSWFPAVAAVALTLLARAATVGAPVALCPKLLRLPPASAAIMVWGGLRGAISIALALSLPSGTQRDTVVMLTYAVVVFSVFAQGLTIERVASRVSSAKPV